MAFPFRFGIVRFFDATVDLLLYFSYRTDIRFRLGIVQAKFGSALDFRYICKPFRGSGCKEGMI